MNNESNTSLLFWPIFVLLCLITGPIGWIVFFITMFFAAGLAVFAAINRSGSA